MDDQTDRLERIEKTLAQLLQYAVRLEWRLEEAGIFVGNTGYQNDTLRFALENQIEPEPDPYADTPILSTSFLTRVGDWLEAHENEEKLSFYELEIDFGGKSARTNLIRSLKYFVVSKEWESVIQKFDDKSGPSEAHSLWKDPYRSERNKRS